MFPHKDIWLRPIEYQDLDFLRDLHNDPTTIMNLTDTTLVNEEQQKRWFESICNSRTSFRMLVLNSEGQGIGCVRLDHYDPRNRSIQVGGDIHRQYRGQGFGGKMFEAILRYVFDVLNCHRAYLSVLETNKVGYSMYCKYGFQVEGRKTQAIFRNGVYQDYIDMFLLEDKYRKMIHDSNV